MQKFQKKLAPLAILFTVASTAPALTHHDNELPDMIETVMPSVAFITFQGGGGSGFVYNAKEGLLVTNNHVIERSGDIQVHFYGGQSFDAELVGTDPGTDIAVIKIKADNLTAVEMGDSDALRLGNTVVAIGNPMGQSFSVSTGIVSGFNRTLPEHNFNRYIQTDAAINSGNSGGPLFDLHGEVIGMNTAILSPTGGSIGIGYAIPSEQIVRIADELITSGKFDRGMMGVSLGDLTDDMAQNSGVDHGSRVSGLVQGMAGELAGLHTGDVITHINGEEVLDTADVMYRIGQMKALEKLEVTVHRDGAALTVPMVLSQRAEVQASEPSHEENLQERMRELMEKLLEERGASGIPGLPRAPLPIPQP